MTFLTKLITGMQLKATGRYKHRELSKFQGRIFNIGCIMINNPDIMLKASYFGRVFTLLIDVG